jgi:hypothetical protein
MKAEITLIYPIYAKMDDYHEEIDALCVTELSNYAHELQRRTGAELVNFHFAEKQRYDPQ